MNIVMMTNTFTPHVGGVARSVEAFTNEYRRRGHRVLVVAPEFENTPEEETEVVRIPAIQRFNRSDFSVALSTPSHVATAVEDFDPDVVHSHHPFLVGTTALRLAHRLELPLVFTHHTMYEQYTHYVPGDSPALRRFVINLTTSYANLADHVIAPSESVASVIRRRGVESPIEVIPTGVDLKLFGRGSGPGFRAVLGIPEDAFVIGHLGRLAPEKNMDFLARAVCAFLQTEPRGHFLVVGKGPSQTAIRRLFVERDLGDRLHFTGTLEHPVISSAYKAMDVFAFASKSETQGMVLTEAVASGVPIVALDAPGAREVVRDRANGRLIAEESIDAFAAALKWVADLDRERYERLRQAALETATDFSMDRSAEKALALYGRLRERELAARPDEFGVWTEALRKIRTEWDLLSGVFGAAGAALNIGERQDDAPG